MVSEGRAGSMSRRVGSLILNSNSVPNLPSNRGMEGNASTVMSAVLSVLLHVCRGIKASRFELKRFMCLQPNATLRVPFEERLESVRHCPHKDMPKTQSSLRGTGEAVGCNQEHNSSLLSLPSSAAIQNRYKHFCL